MSNLFQCTPVSYFWNKEQHGHCIPNALITIGMTNGVLSFVGDLVILCMPLPMIWKLQIDRRRKIALSGMFMLGGLYINPPQFGGKFTNNLQCLSHQYSPLHRTRTDQCKGYHMFVTPVHSHCSILTWFQSPKLRQESGLTLNSALVSHQEISLFSDLFSVAGSALAPKTPHPHQPTAKAPSLCPIHCLESLLLALLTDQTASIGWIRARTMQTLRVLVVKWN
jgi:hypothetical protein